MFASRIGTWAAMFRGARDALGNPVFKYPSDVVQHCSVDGIRHEILPKRVRESCEGRVLALRTYTRPFPALTSLRV
jgi:hypothetical protein